jgi:UDPglucose 6-dehydrogenase
VSPSNNEHKNWVKRKLQQEFSALSGVTIAIWGLTYKPGTDTLRRSLAVELCDWLLIQGAKVKVYDPEVKQIPERWVGKVVNCHSEMSAVEGADGLVVGTEWPQFKQSAADLVKITKTDFIVIDANRHLHSLAMTFNQAGINYVAVGTPGNLRVY